MKAKVLKIEETNEIILPWGRGFSHTWKKDEAITIRAKGFEVTVHSQGAKIDYTIFRNHDHDNSPSIFFNMPEEGCVKEFDNDATLTVQSDSGHLSLKMLYNDYVWETGLELVVKKQEYEKLKHVYRSRGTSALLATLGIIEEESQ